MSEHVQSPKRCNKTPINENNCKRIVTFYKNLETVAEKASALFLWIILLLINALFLWVGYNVCDPGIHWLRILFLIVLGVNLIAPGVFIVYLVGMLKKKVQLLTPFLILALFFALGITLIFLGCAETVRAKENVCYLFAAVFFIGLFAWYALTWHWLRVDIKNGCYRGTQIFPPKRIPKILFWIVICTVALAGVAYVRGEGIFSFLPSATKSIYITYICVLANAFLSKMICVTLIYCYIILHRNNETDD